MPSQRHESLVELLRQDPAAIFELLQTTLRVPLPASPPIRARVSSEHFSDIRPPEYEADLVIIADSAALPAVIVEVQLKVDGDKRRSWPVYVAGLGSSRSAGAMLVVVTPSQATERWARTPIPLGHPGFTLTPLVLGPAHIPRITDPEQAVASPTLAILSVMAHGRAQNAEPVGRAGIAAAETLDTEETQFYVDLVLSELSKHARHILEAELMMKDYTPRTDFFERFAQKNHEEGREEGRCEGLARALLAVLSTRGLALSPAQQQRVLDERDPDRLQAWLRAAVTVDAAAEIFQA